MTGSESRTKESAFACIASVLSAMRSQFHDCYSFIHKYACEYIQHIHSTRYSTSSSVRLISMKVFSKSFLTYSWDDLLVILGRAQCHVLIAFMLNDWLRVNKIYSNAQGLVIIWCTINTNHHQVDYCRFSANMTIRAIPITTRASIRHLKRARLEYIGRIAHQSTPKNRELLTIKEQ